MRPLSEQEAIGFARQIVMQHLRECGFGAASGRRAAGVRHPPCRNCGQLPSPWPMHADLHLIIATSTTSIFKGFKRRQGRRERSHHSVRCRLNASRLPFVPPVFRGPIIRSVELSARRSSRSGVSFDARRTVRNGTVRHAARQIMSRHYHTCTRLDRVSLQCLFQCGVSKCRRI